MGIEAAWNVFSRSMPMAFARSAAAFLSSVVMMRPSPLGTRFPLPAPPPSARTCVLAGPATGERTSIKAASSRIKTLLRLRGFTIQLLPSGLDPRNRCAIGAGNRVLRWFVSTFHILSYPIMRNANLTDPGSRQGHEADGVESWGRAERSFHERMPFTHKSRKSGLRVTEAGGFLRGRSHEPLRSATIRTWDRTGVHVLGFLAHLPKAR
jgi:hypothetical protein